MSSRFASLVLALAGLFAAVPAAQAETSANRALGFGHFLDNDLLGDGGDRWQSGSYTLSWLRGAHWDGVLPTSPFEIFEYRLSGAVIAPSRLRNPPPGDRRYAGKSEFALHTQYAPAPGLEADLGLGLVWVGPSNGISDIQRALHKLLNGPTPTVADDQLPDHLYPMASVELARPVSFGSGAELRPFVEARAGDETFLRAGADLAFGNRERGALWLRDAVTGQRYVGIGGEGAQRTSFVVGADMAHIFDSGYFPAGGPQAETTRSRVRAGVQTRLGAVGVFYGATWLSKEFVGQPEGQVVGSMRLRMEF